ncbi:MAG: DUF1700 domain-containing protein [Brevundimonas sp.]|uniref:DUF1700 domain-containing protein n=1 Tax=Brevundimonas sp. TaxID=1871086 RepID=UPI0039188A10
MTREEFLSRLKRGLVGLPMSSQAEILSDYETHFDDGRAAGRTEAEVSAALGDPDRLARELKAEAGFKRWREEKNPSAAAGAVMALVGLGALDILILLPLLTAVVSAMAGFYLAGAGVFIAGGGIMVAGPFFGPPGGPLFAILLGLGMMGAAIAGLALLTIFAVWLVNGLIWFARLHYRLLKPALANTDGPSADARL